MSWTAIFPVLDQQMMDAFNSEVQPEEEAEFEEWFGVEAIYRIREVERDPGCARHVVSSTLFWKHANASDPDLPAPKREFLVDARRLGLVRRFSPWESYIEPLWNYSNEVINLHPDVEFRIYLANDLDFLVPELLSLGWEIRLMKSSSIRYCPGGFWRFLALEDPDSIVTVIDSDRIGEVAGEIARTRLMGDLDFGLWRVPGYYNSPITPEVRYRPILGGHFGAKGGLLPIRRLIEAFVWHGKHGSLPMTAKFPVLGEIPIKFTRWPDYGFDEWFQLAAIYPRYALEGILTFLPMDARSLLLPLDIEYVTWANSRSEVVYF